MEKFSYLKSTNAGYIDELFALYSQDPNSVDPSWRYFFEGLELGTDSPAESSSAPVAQSSAPQASAPQGDTKAELKVAELILAYRELGRLLAQVDPMIPAPSSHPLLELSRFGLQTSDLSKTFMAGRLLGFGEAKLSDIIARLKDTYCGSVAVEFTHIPDVEEKAWLQQKMETARNREPLDKETQKFILKRLSESESFEKFLHTRYVAQKRFSIEGAEAVIPSLDCMMEVGAELGATQFVLGMAHRGRLNVLTNTCGKKPEQIFTQFEGNYKVDPAKGEGDVKYHMGYSSDLTTRKGKTVHLSLASNPSHLEFVNPVIEGVARAKQHELKDTDRSKVIPVAIHGDAAFAGQGVCYETLNLSQLRGYATGGTLHIVINNKVGFTTDSVDARSTPYCTDMAKMLNVPIFHVNGDDVEAMWYISKLCVEYRQKFKKDVFIDLMCYRKHGHNEGDEPAFTQPIEYKAIKAHPTPREVYAKQLASNGVVSSQESDAIVQQIMDRLTQSQTIAKTEAPSPYVSVFEGQWKGFKRPQESDIFKTVDTAVDEKTLKSLAEKLNRFPSGFHLNSKLVRIFEARLKAVNDGVGIDWGNGETLAFASLLNEGHLVRLSGQDVERGTFSHRHSVLHDSETGETYTPLNQLGPNQGLYDVHNSNLSETGVLGFEYGFSLADPKALVIWEAQFGDFSNGAQVIIDQFISTSESKWQRMSGLTLLLPHGFEGQGPEHSSARLERYLQLCGKNNMIVANLSTPAQLFHALRRQVKRDFRKPMIVMSPKMILRHPMAVSTLKDLSQGSFQEVLDDPSFSSDQDAASARKVVLCTGKIYYELLAKRTAQKKNDVALVRIEQLYPWPADKLAQILGRYKKASLVWAQEEPRNMGAWSFVFNTWSGGYDFFQEKAGNRPIGYAGRAIAASPAVGSHKVHEREQEALIEEALK